MSIDSPILPKPKKPVKYTPASLRIMQTCDKAFHEHHFVLLYFTNRKQFNQMFTEPNFKHLVKSHFTFLQLSRADKSGNWLTTTYHFESSPYYAILDPSTGNFLTIYYGDMTLEELSAWLSKFSSKFANSTSIFSSLIDELQEAKRKSAFAYGTKLRVTFVCSKFEDRVLYVNKLAPFQIAFEKYCSEQNIEMDQYYFLFKGVQLPPEMTASQFGLRNGSVINVHHLEDRTSTEQISITVLGVDNNSSVYHVHKGKKISQFLRSYCEANQLQMENIRFTYKSDLVTDDLTFAEHKMKDGDQISAHIKTFSPPADYFYRMKLNDLPSVDAANFDMQFAQLNQMQQMALQQPPMMYMYNQAQRAQLTPPGMQQIPSMTNQINSQINSQLNATLNPQINQQIPAMNQIPQMSQQMSGQIGQQMPQMAQQMTMPPIPGQMPSFNQVPYQVPGKYPFPKPPLDQNQNQTMWDGVFDMNMNT
ncbi:hypothetical protein TRFO_02935 [Tritrichomonas foetus]|uniref:Ubiquitin-like domain-containing protein n=1 Tax=Tritrichomonas foetus TaxID=1144522 RepID=A0A1J4KXG5_9EUKA|nr:hypothetical protein TRFO_02935 [Tritrichomonas foetus]|eukprot:OHT15576.1 hypothetical protein TRFO_02935 [Tritrichomonas foetus]